MVEWIAFIIQSLQTNPLVAGLFGTAFMGSFVYLIKNNFLNFILSVFNYLTTTISIYQIDNWDTYYGINQFFIGKKLKAFHGHYSFLLNQQRNSTGNTIIEKSKPVAQVVNNKSSNRQPNKNIFSFLKSKLKGNKSDFNFLTFSDDHWYYYNHNGLRFFIQRSTDSGNKMEKRYIIKFRFLTRNKIMVNKFLEHIIAEQEKLDKISDNLKVFYNDQSNWRKLYGKTKVYGMKTPFFISDVYSDVYKNVATFLNSKNKYASLGRPYYDGMIFYGSPGCGKSYFIQQVCSDFDLPCYVINMTSFKSDADLISLIGDVSSQPSVILFEDIDCLGIERNISSRTGNSNETDSKNITLSTMLNILDGIYGINTGLIFIATTNHVSKLDAAFMRSGRFNMQIEFKPLVKKEICNVLYNFYDSHSSIKLNDNVTIPISDLSNLCFKIKNVDDCVHFLNAMSSKS